jgi:hypothetical protein
MSLATNGQYHLNGIQWQKNQEESSTKDLHVLGHSLSCSVKEHPSSIFPGGRLPDAEVLLISERLPCEGDLIHDHLLYQVLSVD